MNDNNDNNNNNNNNNNDNQIIVYDNYKISLFKYPRQNTDKRVTINRDFKKYQGTGFILIGKGFLLKAAQS